MRARNAVGGSSAAAAGATIPYVDKVRPDTLSEADARLDEQMEESRRLMMRRVKQMSVEDRLALFDRLSRRVSWARSAKRIR